jgi:hypothetical protein
MMRKTKLEVHKLIYKELCIRSNKILLYYSNPAMVVPINKVNKFEVEGVKITKMAACVPTATSTKAETV